MSHLPIRLGRYELLGEIASGGMATVYVGRKSGTAGFERTVAIKRLHRHLAQDPDFVAMFLDEARLAGRIGHPNVVEVYDVELFGGELCIEMSYIEGASLAAILAQLRRVERRLPLGVALRITCDALFGLHAAHQLESARGELVGLVHRDVSPQNLLVGTDGITRVTDFGVAKAAGRLAATRDDAIKGKLRYLAPEQLRRETIDHRVDVFAAGIVLWECLTGRSLFACESDARTLMAVLDAPIAPPSTHRAEVGIALDEACLGALDRDPARRYPSAAAFAETLERAAGKRMAAPRDVGRFVEELMQETLVRRRGALRAGAEAAALVMPGNGGELPASTPAPRGAGATEVMAASARTSGAASRWSRAVRSRARLPLLAMGAIALAALAGASGWYAAHRGVAAPAAEAAPVEPAPSADVPSIPRPAPATASVDPVDSAAGASRASVSADPDAPAPPPPRAATPRPRKPAAKPATSSYLPSDL